MDLRFICLGDRLDSQPGRAVKADLYHNRCQVKVAYMRRTGALASAVFHNINWPVIALAYAQGLNCVPDQSKVKKNSVHRRGSIVRSGTSVSLCSF
jgi:tetrahydromethanopterin S-methyltransferase subunit D